MEEILHQLIVDRWFISLFEGFQPFKVQDSIQRSVVTGGTICKDSHSSACRWFLPTYNKAPAMFVIEATRIRWHFFGEFFSMEFLVILGTQGLPGALNISG